MDTKNNEKFFGSENSDKGLSDEMKKVMISTLRFMKEHTKVLIRNKKRMQEQETKDKIDSVKENIDFLHKKFLEDLQENIKKKKSS